MEHKNVSQLSFLLIRNARGLNQYETSRLMKQI
jgi:hypothetical protein